MRTRRAALLVITLLLLTSACNPAAATENAAPTVAPAPAEASATAPTERSSLDPTIAPVETAGPEDPASAGLDLPPGVEPLPEPNPIDLEITLDEGSTVEAEIGSAGGTLELAAADGTSYLLEIPPDALFSPELIRMTAAASVEGVPFEAGAQAAVLLEPDGLVFYQPVTLRIQLPEGVATQDLASFRTQAAGQDFHLYPSTQEGNSLELRLSHFTEAGVVSPTNAEIIRIENLYTPTQSDAYAQNTTAIVFKTVDDPQARADAVEKVARQWLYNSVLTRLKNAAVFEDRLDQALGEYFAWLAYQRENFSEDDFNNRLLDENDLALDAIVAALNSAFDKAGRRCVQGNDPVEALKIWRWGFVAQFLDLFERSDFQLEALKDAIGACLNFKFVFRSKIEGKGSEGGSYVAQVFSEIPIASRFLDAENQFASLKASAPAVFEINQVDPEPPECSSLSTNGTMEVLFLASLNLNTREPSFAAINLFWDFPGQPEEAIRCIRGGQSNTVQTPRWMPIYEAVNSGWGSVAAGFNTTLPIVSRGEVFAELVVERGVPGMDASELSTYQLIHTPGE